MEHPWDVNRKRAQRKWADPRVALWMSSKGNAQQTNVSHTISKEDIIIPSHCPVLGMKLQAGGRANNSMSLDKVVPSKGYVPGNVCVISLKANRLKQDSTLEDLEKIIEYVKRNS